jgi:hypothetical protein
MAQRIGKNGSNILHRELTMSVERRTLAAPAAVYDVLADLRTHAVWGGEQQSETARLLSVDAPEGEASVGTEFETTGADPMGRFADRSVVTTAIRPSVFEFVTEATLETKKGDRSDWTNVHRYELRPDGEGTTIVYTLRIARISALPGLLRLFNLPVLSGIAMKMAASVPRRGIQNLARMAEQRAGAR